MKKYIPVCVGDESGYKYALGEWTGWTDTNKKRLIKYLKSKAMGFKFKIKTIQQERRSK